MTTETINTPLILTMGEDDGKPDPQDDVYEDRDGWRQESESRWTWGLFFELDKEDKEDPYSAYLLSEYGGEWLGTFLDLNTAKLAGRLRLAMQDGFESQWGSVVEELGGESPCI